MGPLSRNNNSNSSKGELVNLPGSYYSDPVFSWYRSIGVTDIEFLKSSKLGEKYKNIYLLVILIMAIYITFSQMTLELG